MGHREKNLGGFICFFSFFFWLSAYPPGVIMGYRWLLDVI